MLRFAVAKIAETHPKGVWALPDKGCESPAQLHRRQAECDAGSLRDGEMGSVGEVDGDLQSCGYGGWVGFVGVLG